jgi:predicted phage terminase large subunit-like protein
MRDKVWEWYRHVVLTRLEPGARIILIMTRWHRDDLAGRILAEDSDWDVLNLPAIDEDGNALWPERYSAKELEYVKVKVGSRVWASLYQGTPLDVESKKFRREWIQWYDNLPKEDFTLPRGAGVDTATSLKSASDNTALVDVCRDKNGFLYIDDVFCEKVTVSGFANHLVNQHAAKRYSMVKLEKNNAGEAFKQRIDEVSRERGVAVPVECEQTTTDKMVRAMEFQPLVENGTIRFRRGSKKVAELVEHLVNFDGKGGDTDDDVDALGFAIKAVLGSNNGAVYTLDYDVRPR